MAEDQVETSADQVAPNLGEQRQTATPAKTRTYFGALIALRNWQIAVTPDRAQVCLWSFIMTTKFLSMLSVISFWVCIIMCTKTLPAWNGPTNVFAGHMRRKDIIRAGNQVDAKDNVWADIFPPMESLEAHSLKIALTETGRPGAPVIYGHTIPLLLKHPLVWASLAALSFLTRGFLSFIHGCLERAYRATTAISRRRSF